jgi:hypothetical protein
LVFIGAYLSFFSSKDLSFLWCEAQSNTRQIQKIVSGRGFWTEKDKPKYGESQC